MPGDLVRRPASCSVMDCASQPPTYRTDREARCAHAMPAVAAYTKPLRRQLLAPRTETLRGARCGMAESPHPAHLAASVPATIISTGAATNVLTCAFAPCPAPTTACLELAAQCIQATANQQAPVRKSRTTGLPQQISVDLRIDVDRNTSLFARQFGRYVSSHARHGEYGFEALAANRHRRFDGCPMQL
ncbi:hypothetical protein FQR65_LT20724 [Abscondita terminalis]|nr:hypothetical protein FQR65_LT20724 [Abscondita terminalis]